jgi:hypothetical protein
MADMDINLAQTKPTKGIVTLIHVIYALHALAR